MTWATEVGEFFQSYIICGNGFKKDDIGSKELSSLVQTIMQGRDISHDENFLSTEFSLKVLLGSKGLPMNTEKRYDKLAAMTQALKERCSLHRCSFHRLFAGHRLKLTN
uniref:Uncharacterized protein n=1 Tax=Wuchereria bancrofti TaxID=6293 RepID=A0A1I8ECL7_WUCBA